MNANFFMIKPGDRVRLHFRIGGAGLSNALGVGVVTAIGRYGVHVKWEGHIGSGRLGVWLPHELEFDQNGVEIMVRLLD